MLYPASPPPPPPPQLSHLLREVPGGGQRVQCGESGPATRFAFPEWLSAVACLRQHENSGSAALAWWVGGLWGWTLPLILCIPLPHPPSTGIC